MRDIEKLVEMGNEANRDLLEGLAMSYKTAVNDNIWVEFEKRFNDVHVDFYHSLSISHPDLTGNERKLCAFLKLDMSSKEIATITFQNAKSIDMARYRLRKKLGLEGEESLQGYLMKF
jgi:DNA-binding CsgD family transcriptional regulator